MFAILLCCWLFPSLFLVVVFSREIFLQFYFSNSYTRHNVCGSVFSCFVVAVFLVSHFIINSTSRSSESPTFWFWTRPCFFMTCSANLRDSWTALVSLITLTASLFYAPFRGLCTRVHSPPLRSSGTKTDDPTMAWRHYWLGPNLANLSFCVSGQPAQFASSAWKGLLLRNPVL